MQLSPHGRFQGYKHPVQILISKPIEQTDISKPGSRK